MPCKDSEQNHSKLIKKLNEKTLIVTQFYCSRKIGQTTNLFHFENVTFQFDCDALIVPIKLRKCHHDNLLYDSVHEMSKYALFLYTLSFELKTGLTLVTWINSSKKCDNIDKYFDLTKRNSTN